jgi:hypothetical protein
VDSLWRHGVSAICPNSMNRCHRREAEQMTNALWPTSCASADDHDSIKEVLATSGFTIFELPDDQISDIEAFFRAVVQVVPTDPPLSGRLNADAFVDSVWEGLRLLGADKVAILWESADRMLNRGLQDLIVISDLFQEIARSLRGTGGGRLPHFSIHLILFGSGPNFPRVRLAWNGTNLIKVSAPEH